MRLQVFQSDKGDCLLLTGRDGTRVLVDGGMRSSYTAHVAPALGRIARDGGELDLVYVSHIDQDHISGVLQLMEDQVAWRVRDYQHGSGNDDFPDPPEPRPPKVKRIWHNAFHETVGDNSGAIEEALAASAAVLEAGERDAERSFAQAQREVANSIVEGIELSRRVGPEQLKIPLNEEFGGKLAVVRDEPQEVDLGSVRLTLLGPFERDLRALRKEWNEWLRDHEDALERVRAKMRADAERLGTGEVERFTGALAARARELGDRGRVTVPNLASIMLLVEEGDTTLLLTGDGHAEDILKGLDAAGRLEEDGAIHVTVLKVQHHGSEHNIDAEFCRRVTADHYVFCANGAHENPDLAVLDAVVRSRESDRRPFKLWFNSSSSATASGEGRGHMEEVERLVDRHVKRGNGRIRAAFLDRDSFVVR